MAVLQVVLHMRRKALHARAHLRAGQTEHEVQQALCLPTHSHLLVFACRLQRVQRQHQR